MINYNLFPLNLQLGGISLGQQDDTPLSGMSIIP